MIKKLIAVFIILITISLSFVKKALDYFNDALAAYQSGNFSEAIKNYNKAIEINPDYADAYYNRGNAKGALGNMQGAIEDFNKALQLNPNDFKAQKAKEFTQSLINK